MIGAFCIPGIAEIEDLDRARDAGLDFIRLGSDAETIEIGGPTCKSMGHAVVVYTKLDGHYFIESPRLSES